MEEPLIDIDELARRLKIAPKTIRNKLSEGTWPIPPVRIGGALRWRPGDVSRAVNELYEKDRHTSRRSSGSSRKGNAPAHDQSKRSPFPARKLKNPRSNRSTGRGGFQRRSHDPRPS
jgi:predicted DNA-binding transcriptional regulator AlpA